MHEDILKIELPYPAYFSEDTECLGRSLNIQNTQICSVCLDLSCIELTLQLPVSTDGRRNLVYDTIEPGESFTFVVTNVKNPPSYEPTFNSITYEVSSQDGDLLETKYDGNVLINDIPGYLDANRNGFLPGIFEQGQITNYTMTLVPENYLQNMKIFVTLPPQIDLDDVAPICIGIAGTDEDEVECILNRRDKTISITNAV